MSQPSSASPYHHGNLRQALIDAGLHQLQQEGPESLSLRALARASGVSQTAPYRHFSDKQDLLAALAAEGFRRLQERSASASSAAPDAPQALLQAGQAYVAFALDEPALYRLMFGPVLSESAEQNTAGQASFGVLVGIAKRGIDEGVFVPQSPVKLARVCWSLVHGVATLLLDQRFTRDSDDTMGVVRETLQLALTGLLKR